MGPDGSDPVNLSNNPADDLFPSWSPDGSQIAFVSNRDDGQFLYLMDADGSNLHLLSQQNGSEWPDWSPDGEMITFTSDADIYIIPADGSTPAVNLTNSPKKDSQPVWSPDGRQIAWLINNGGDQWNAWIMNTDGSNVRQLTNDNRVTDIAWTVDGQLFFALAE
jgi:Tol biopolymer transport system component